MLEQLAAQFVVSPNIFVMVIALSSIIALCAIPSSPTTNGGKVLRKAVMVASPAVCVLAIAAFVFGFTNISESYAVDYSAPTSRSAATAYVDEDAVYVASTTPVSNWAKHASGEYVEVCDIDNSDNIRYLSLFGADQVRNRRVLGKAEVEEDLEESYVETYTVSVDNTCFGKFLDSSDGEYVVVHLTTEDAERGPVELAYQPKYKEKPLDFGSTDNGKE